MAADPDQTQPLDPKELRELLDLDDLELHELLGISDEEIEVARKKTPEPALVRGVILALVNLVGVVFGVSLDIAWLDPLMYVYGVVGPIALAFWIRRNVSPAVRKA